MSFIVLPRTHFALGKCWLLCTCRWYVTCITFTLDLWFIPSRSQWAISVWYKRLYYYERWGYFGPMGRRGSCWPIWCEQIKDAVCLAVCDWEMMRVWVLLKCCLNLTYHSAAAWLYGVVFIFKYILNYKHGNVPVHQRESWFHDVLFTKNVNMLVSPARINNLQLKG